jgi:predicted PurR-regulated permease PerM
MLQPPTASNRTGAADQLGAGTAARPTGRLRAAWNALCGAIGALVGLAPHVLHHVGLVAGAAFLTGAVGTALFGVLGLLASAPMLLRLRRRFGTWRAPAIALVVFSVMFVLSAFVVGPAITAGDEAPAPAPTQPVGPDAHHEG